MASNYERTLSICDALINGASSLEQQDLLARALHDDVNGPYDSLTNSQKAATIPREVRAWCLGKIRVYQTAEAVAAVKASVPGPEQSFPEG